MYVFQSVCENLTEQHVEEPCVEVVCSARVLTHADSRAGRCSANSGRTGLQIGNKGLQQHLHTHSQSEIISAIFKVVGIKIIY